MKRPQFNKHMNSDEFQKYYWYKTELQEICRTYKLPSYGTKYELTRYIVSFLDGTSIKQIKPIRKNRRNTKEKNSSNEISPSTPILDSGFSLNNEARKFFCQYYRVPKFSFTKPMGIKMREIEQLNDKKATVKDLIDVYENKIFTDLSKNNEENTYQWNNFVKAFREDPLSIKFNTPMKVASILWQHVRNSDQEKKYNTNLINQHYDEIKPYLKKESLYRD
ncbi:SAP domain-containing protein [Leuconostoc citreum]|uniref:SAP domain-containing protein n=1 Tax=Leuconostoc citreum TaxID=33964 RepID=UPI0032DED5B2